jgi:hypothetical protein
MILDTYPTSCFPNKWYFQSSWKKIDDNYRAKPEENIMGCNQLGILRRFATMGTEVEDG